MGKQTTWEADGWVAFVEEDKPEEGCVGDSIAKSGPERFIGKTPSECVEACRAFCGADPGAVELDPCGDDPGRVDMQVCETDDACVATEADIEAWKAGHKRLWLADYSFHVRKVTREDVALPDSAAKHEARAAVWGPCPHG